MFTGAFVTGLEYATGVNATVIGKPNKAFFHEALKLAEVAPEKAIMVGDVCVTSSMCVCRDLVLLLSVM